MEHEQREARRELWLAWETRYWEGVEARLGSSSSAGPQRTYDDVTVMLDPWSDEGECDFIVAESSLGLPGSSVPHIRFRDFWDRHEPSAIVGRTLELVERMRADPVHQMIHRARG